MQLTESQKRCAVVVRVGDADKRSERNQQKHACGCVQCWRQDGPAKQHAKVPTSLNKAQCSDSAPERQPARKGIEWYCHDKERHRDGRSRVDPLQVTFERRHGE